MKYILLLIFIGLAVELKAQRVVFDKGHFNQVLENQAVRTSAELATDAELKSINKSVDDINFNIASVTLVHQAIFNSLNNVNHALKEGLVIKNMTTYVSDIVKYSNQLLDEGKTDPHLLLFAEKHVQWSRERITNLVLEVNDFITNEGVGALMDFSKRDWLINNVNTELLLLRASLYNANRSLHYARINGVLKSLNPYQGFINQDQQLLNEVIRNTNYLKK